MERGKPGAPKGSQNAKGNRGGGAPLGSKNALKHGGYAAIHLDTLTELERELIESMPQDPETLLVEQLRLFTVRERSLMTEIKKHSEVKARLVVSGTKSSEYNTNETKEATYNIVQRLHAELTKVQRAKTSCLDSITYLHIENKRLETLRKGEDV